MNNPSGQGNGKGFLGAGLAFPLRVDSEGRLMMTSLETHVQQSIFMIMETLQGERVMRPDFGGGLDTLVFAPNNAATLALVDHTVRSALLQWEPRIDVLQVSVTLDPDQPELLQIYLNYRVRQTDTMFNLVYPFYLERGQS